MKLNRVLSIYDKTLQGSASNDLDELGTFLRIDNKNIPKKNSHTINKGTSVETKEFNQTKDEKEKEAITKGLESHNTNPFTSLSYLPKRKVKFNAANLLSYSNQPRPLLKRTPEEGKERITAYQTTVIVSHSNKSSIISSNPLQNILLHGGGPTKAISENEYLTFKTNYILKFARNKEAYQKTSNFLSKISDENKKHTIEFYRRLLQISEKKDRVLFDSMNFNVMNSAAMSQTDANLNYHNWKECTLLFYELETFWLKLSEIALKELSAAKESNVHLAKKLSDQNHVMKKQENEISKLKSFIEVNNINSKSLKALRRMKELDSMKEEYEKKENLNVYNVFRLEEE